jgi:TRAP-type C4-dicarboxylate transport system permease small subunit
MLNSPSAVRISRVAFHSIPLGLAALFLVAAVAINFANVIGRYMFSAAIYWAEEAMIYLSIWSIFLAAAAVAYDGTALTMDFFSARLPVFWKRFIDAAIASLTVAICLFMSWQSVLIARVFLRNEQKSVALEIPMLVPQASLLFGFLAIACAVTVRFLQGRQIVEPSAVPGESDALP